MRATTTVWKLRKFTLALAHFNLKFRENDVFTKEVTKNWFHEIFISENKFLFFPHCDNVITTFTEKSHFFRQINLFTKEVMKELISRKIRVIVTCLTVLLGTFLSLFLFLSHFTDFVFHIFISCLFCKDCFGFKTETVSLIWIYSFLRILKSNQIFPEKVQKRNCVILLRVW